MMIVFCYALALLVLIADNAKPARIPTVSKQQLPAADFMDTAAHLFADYGHFRNGCLPDANGCYCDKAGVLTIYNDELLCQKSSPGVKELDHSGFYYQTMSSFLPLVSGMNGMFQGKINQEKLASVLERRFENLTENCLPLQMGCRCLVKGKATGYHEKNDPRCFKSS